MREPWHDLHCRIEGTTTYDLLQNFEERWLRASKPRGLSKIKKFSDDVLLKLDKIPVILGITDARYTSEKDPECWHVQVLYTWRVGDARYPHPSHWGKVCYTTTPDGENCGLVKNLPSIGLVSTYVEVNLLDILIESGMEELVDNMSISLGRKHTIFVNEDWVGVSDDPTSLVDDFRSKRRRKKVPYQVYSTGSRNASSQVLLLMLPNLPS